MSKLSNMILFFSEKLKPTETTLNKLLFYSDFLNYKNTGYSISGVNYMAHNYGPVPVDYSSLFDYASKKGYFSMNYVDFGNGYIGKLFEKSNQKDFDEEIFSPNEIESLNSVVETFRYCNAKQIMEKSHEEKPWIDNEKTKGRIDYNYAFDLKHI